MFHYNFRENQRGPVATIYEVCSKSTGNFKNVFKSNCRQFVFNYVGTHAPEV